MTPQSITMSGKYQTRDGQPARVVDLNGPNKFYPVIAIVGDAVLEYPRDGILDKKHPLSSDLLPVRKRLEVEMWTNFYRNECGKISFFSHPDKYSADHYAGSRIACIHAKREIMEGEGL